MKRGGQIAIILAIALALASLPGGGAAVEVFLTLLTAAFFSAVALMGYRLFCQHRIELDSLTDRQRTVLYGSVGLAFLTLCASTRMFDSGSLGALAWIALLGISVYGLWWVWNQYRAYV